MRRRDVVLTELVELFLSEGFSRFSLEDLAARLRCSKSTLYGLAPSKEQLITAVVREFFRGATERVEARLAGSEDPVSRLQVYLHAISTELAPGSPAFFADLEAFAPARQVYSTNTAIAARRVDTLVREAGDAAVPPPFLGAVAGLVMEAIHSGVLARSAGITDAAAYDALAQLVVAGLRAPR
ncbi:TetR/AcrR family transcriptional regulator [Nocardioides sp. 1609]|uniref:TetR/AcrR family transcriptional regulator n=1 Tax=Nocardioides sp. 1609 TaxID=2508327 RepID=UPI001ADAA9DD|nr:TetR/AcrR family transcriptional regulator [Nocardioides sp. 1609]